MLANLCLRWQVLEFAAGRNQENQDVYVLRRGAIAWTAAA